MISERSGKSGVFSFTTSRPVAVLMVVAAVAVFGYISYKRLALNLMPDITYPTLTVRTEYPGNAPQELETAISRPIEQALGVVGSLVSISSVSRAGLSDVILEFDWDTDMDQAAQDIRERLDGIFLPDEAERPLLLRYDPSLDAVLRLAIYGDQDLYSLRWLAEEQIKRRLSEIPGVAAVRPRGGLEEEIRVELSEQKLATLGMGIGQINMRLAQENVNLAGGNLKEGDTEYLVRTLNEFQSLEEIENVVIANLGGADIRLSDIGTVVRDHKDREVITRINGREGVEIDIYREADANIVDVADRVKEAVFGSPAQQAYVRRLEEEGPEEKKKPEKKKSTKEGKDGDKGNGDMPDDSARVLQKEMTSFLRYSLPETTEVEILSDQSIFIENSISEVRRNAVVGGLVAILIVFLFLRRVRNTVIVGIAIPASIVAAFVPMHLVGVSLNIMSLGGLALGVGMLVDNAIVVLESIFRRREGGDSVMEAAVRGVSEVGSAVVASTMTTIAVFFPIVFVEGVAGQIFGDQALTVVFSVLASLLVALFFIPVLASRQIIPDKAEKGVSSFFRFRCLPARLGALSARTESDPPVGRVSLLLFPVELTGKLLRLLVTDLVVLLKWILTTLVLLVLLLVTPLLAIVPYPLPLPKRLLEKIAQWSSRPDLFGRATWSQAIWSKILCMEAPAQLAQDMVKYREWRKGAAGRSTIRRSLSIAGRWLLGIPSALFMMVRSLFHHVIAGLAGRMILTGGLLTVLGLTLALAQGNKAGFFMTGLHMVGLIALGLAAVASVFLVILWPLGWLLDGVYGAVRRIYPSILRFSLDHQGSVLASALAVLIFTIVVLVPGLGSELIPTVHQGEFNLEVQLPVGTPLEATDATLRPIESRILEESDVARVATTVGVERESNASSDEGENTGRFTITLDRAASPIVQETSLIDRLREDLSNYPEVRTRVTRPVLFSFKTPIEVEVHGYDLTVLRAAAEQVETALAKLPGLADVKSNLQAGNPEVQIVYDREALAAQGLDIFQVASLVRNKVAGSVPTEYSERDRRIDIRVRVREEDKLGVEDLKRLIVNPGGPTPIPLSAVADIGIMEGPSEIRRIDQQRAALITANLSRMDLGTASTNIEECLRGLTPPGDVTYLVSGQNKEMRKSLTSMLFALVLAVFLVYVVMASQFESLLHPLVIMFSIPLAGIGAVAVLYIMQIPLSVVVYLGFIMLAGIVVNNAIVLVDYINLLRNRGMERSEAIIEAGKARLRPILMTTATTVFGLLPMALGTFGQKGQGVLGGLIQLIVGTGDSAEIRSPMAITVMAGLITSTILTLVIVPTLYAALDRGRKSPRKKEIATENS